MAPAGGPARRFAGRSGALLVAVGLLAIGTTAALLGGRLAGSEHAEPWPGPPLDVDQDTDPKLGEIPNLALMGDEVAPSTDRLCDDERIARMTGPAAGVVGLAEDGVFVDERGWNDTTWGRRVGLASFWSKCLHGGAALHVRADGDGALLAVYDPDTGLAVP